MLKKYWFVWNTLFALLLMAITFPQFATSIMGSIIITALSFLGAFVIILILGAFLDYLEKRPLLYALAMMILGLIGIWLFYKNVMSHW